MHKTTHILFGRNEDGKYSSLYMNENSVITLFNNGEDENGAFYIAEQVISGYNYKNGDLTYVVDFNAGINNLINRRLEFISLNPSIMTKFLELKSKLNIVATLTNSGIEVDLSKNKFNKINADKEIEILKELEILLENKEVI